MSKIIVCHNCKAILSPGSSFCSQCGARITEADYVSQSDGESNPIYLRPGTVLRMKYRINGVIGQGGFGITYDGTDIKLNMHVAIKEYFPNTMANRHATISLDVSCSDNTRGLYEQGMKNFLKEAQNMAKYAGEDNFVAVHDFFPENNTAYIIMEFVEGQNLKQYLQQHGRLTMNETMPIILPVMNVGRASSGTWFSHVLHELQPARAASPQMAIMFFIAFSFSIVSGLVAGRCCRNCRERKPAASLSRPLIRWCWSGWTARVPRRATPASRTGLA